MGYPEPTWLHDDYLVSCSRLLDGLGLQQEARALRQAFAAEFFLEELQVEYTRLFITGVPCTIAPPYGSVYLSGSGTLYGPTTERVKAFYRQQGVEPLEGEVPDSLHCQLQFLALLCEQGRHQAEEEFLRLHFRPWFGLFRKRVQDKAIHRFYPLIAQLIDQFTREETADVFSGDAA